MAAEDHVQEVAVERRAREVGAHRHPTCCDVHPPVVEYLFAVDIDQVGGHIAAPAKDLLHSIQVVVQEIGAGAAAVQLHDRGMQGEAGEAEQLLAVEIDRKPELRGIVDPLPLATRDDGGDLRVVVDPDINAVVLEPRPRAAPVAP